MDFNIDDALGKFGVKSKDAQPSSFDIDSILSKFDNGDAANKKAIAVRPVAPPISGATPEQSNEINSQPAKAGGANPRDSALAEGIKDFPGNVGGAIKQKYNEGRQLAGEGLEDIAAGKPATGALKVGGGALAAVTAPIAGTVQEAVEKPVTQLTGNPAIGDRAGFVVNSAIPVVPGVNAAARALPKNKALRTLVESIGPEKAGEVAAAMKANPRLTPADLSPKVRQDTQNLFVTDGKHVNYLADTVEHRLSTAKKAVDDAMTGSLGHTVDAVKKLDELKANIRSVGKSEIEPVIANKPYTDITDVIHHIDSEIGTHALKALKNGVMHPEINATKQELYAIRQKLRGDWPDRDQMLTHTDTLHDVQKKLREKAEGLKASSDGSQRLLSGELFKIREKLKDAVGPEYKAALGKYKDEIDIQEAFHHGHDAIITNSKAIENRPEFFQKWVDKASPEELHAAREGARIAIDTQINGFKHAARRGTDVGEIEFNRQRIEALFGKTEADKLFTALKHERAIADTNAKLVQGSQTAMRNSSKAAFELPTKSEAGRTLLPAAILEGANMLSSGVPGIGVAAYAGSRAMMAAKDRIKLLVQKEHNAQYAKLALPVEGPSRDALIKSLEDVSAAQSAKPSMLRRAANLSRLVGP